MRLRHVLSLKLLFLGFVVAEEEALPFDPGIISRLSLDGVPRSLSIRGGGDFWIGYDLERGTPFHVWRANSDAPGLVVTGFTSRSDGETCFVDSSKDTWRLFRAGKPVDVTFRYLSCSDRGEMIELRWELRHEEGSVTLCERLFPQARGTGAEELTRHIEVAGLGSGETLHPPTRVAQEWLLLGSDEDGKTTIVSNGVYRLLLSP